MAWLLATCGDGRIRDGAVAVNFAVRACELMQWASYPYFDTLAAAYAEVGDFDRACEWQVKALDAAADDEKPDFQRRLAMYEQHQPFRGFFEQSD